MAERSLTGDVELHLTRIGAALDRYLETGTDPVARRAEWTDALVGPLPEHGVGARAVIDELAGIVIPNGARMSDPGFWGWITCGPDTVPLVAATAASLASPQRYSITAFNLLEELSLRWLGQLAGLAPGMLGVYSSGGSVANLVALGAARQWAFEQRGVDVAAEGVDGATAAIYASAEVHHTVQRSAAVLGIGRSRVRVVPTDDRQRMRVEPLRQALEDDRAAGIVPVAVVGTAGTTNTGAIDPLRAIGELAREFGAWFHVDGAYGLLGSLDERVAPLYDGLDLADSVIVDPHKWLGAPTGIGATFVRDRSILFRAFTQEPAAYLETIFGGTDDDAESSLDSVGIPYSEFGVELSAPARGAVVWSILRELGRDGVAARIRRDNDHARHLAELVRRHPRLELLTEPVLSICCFRYAGEGIDDLDTFNAAILRRLHHDSAYLPSSTRVGGSFALRPCFVNSRTPDGAVESFVAEVVAIGDALLAGDSA
jgi:aromatic-L-amino-acid decarboxylase